jgi:hypothetical protein
MNLIELLKINKMTFEKKVLLLFKDFPKKQYVLEEIIKTLPRSSKYGITITASFEYSYYISIYVEGLGSFRKNWEEDIVTDKRTYTFSYSEGDDLSVGKGIFSFGKEESDKICERALPFMLSKGKNRKLIPLIIHDFPEFAKFALEYPK